jgi:hypothetical protein
MPGIDSGAAPSEMERSVLKTDNGPPYEDFEGHRAILAVFQKQESSMVGILVSRVRFLLFGSSCTTCQHLANREGTPLNATAVLLDIPKHQRLGGKGQRLEQVLLCAALLSSLLVNGSSQTWTHQCFAGKLYCVDAIQTLNGVNCSVSCPR